MPNLNPLIFQPQQILQIVTLQVGSHLSTLVIPTIISVHQHTLVTTEQIGVPHLIPTIAPQHFLTLDKTLLAANDLLLDLILVIAKYVEYRGTLPKDVPLFAWCQINLIHLQLHQWTILWHHGNLELILQPTLLPPLRNGYWTMVFLIMSLPTWVIYLSTHLTLVPMTLWLVMDQIFL